jgi:hypothetical protein
MEPEGSIPNSQELSTCSYPEKITYICLSNNLIIILSFIIAVKQMTLWN